MPETTKPGIEPRQTDLFQDIVHNIQDDIWVADERDRIVYWSPGMVRITGISSPEILGLTVVPDFKPETIQYIVDHYFQAKNALKPTEYLTRVITATGRTTMQTGWCIPRVKNNTYQGMICTARDITEVIEAEQALKASEQKYRIISQLTSDYIFRVDVKEDGQISMTMASERYTADTGRAPDEARTPAQWKEIVHPEDADRFFDTFSKLIVNQGKTEFEGRFRTKQGPYRWVHVLAKTVTDPVTNKTKEVIGAVADISARKEAELQKDAALLALQDSEKRYRSIVENVNDALYIHDFNGNIFDVNEAACRMLGYRKEELIGANLVKIDAPEDSEMMKVRMQELFDTGYLLFEAHHVAKSGQRIPVSVSGKIVDRQGPGLVQGFVRDVSAVKKSEELLRNAQKLESLGVLAGGIAHDFNNLLGGIFGYIDLARTETTDAGLVGYLNKAMSAIERTRNLTRQLLTFAKGGAPIRKPSDLVPFVQETVQFALSGSNVSCCFDFPRDLWLSQIDENQIGQVIDNIVINAQQAMPMGGLIQISASNFMIKDKVHPVLRPGNYVRLSFQDSGIGIPNEILPRIFDPFFTTKFEGHGLGLAMCHSIVRRHGGSIEVESCPGQGSTFYVYLPALTQAENPKQASCRVWPRGSGTVLVMDDEEVIRDTVGDMLKSLGYTPILKSNGPDTVEFFVAETKANRALSGVILDLTVPGGMGGKEVVQEIRKWNATIPIFVASGYAEDPIIANPKQYGFTASFCKPFGMAELAQTMAEHLSPPQ